MPPFHCPLMKLLGMVPRKGLEPPHLASAGPKPAASTNFATWALLCRDISKQLTHLEPKFIASAFRHPRADAILRDFPLYCSPNPQEFQANVSRPLREFPRSEEHTSEVQSLRH